VPGVLNIPVEIVELVLPRFPFTIPKPEHAVALVELKLKEEEFPVIIVDGEKGLRVTVGGDTHTEPFQYGADAGHTLSVTDC
jgi:hypothetical protein